MPEGSAVKEEKQRFLGSLGSGDVGATIKKGLSGANNFCPAPHRAQRVKQGTRGPTEHPAGAWNAEGDEGAGAQGRWARGKGKQGFGVPGPPPAPMDFFMMRDTAGKSYFGFWVRASWHRARGQPTCWGFIAKEEGWLKPASSASFTKTSWVPAILQDAQDVELPVVVPEVRTGAGSIYEGRPD